MFAAAVGPGAIYIYNFYTMECPQNMQCKGHATVRGIDWFDDEYKGKILEKYHVIKQHYERVKSNEAITEWLSRRPVTKY
jgi:hypothetical protein